MKEYPEDKEQFCVDLQSLLDKYSVPTIMRNAQSIFHNTLSYKLHPELHPNLGYIVRETDHLAKFVTDGKQLSAKIWVDEALDMKKKDNE